MIKAVISDFSRVLLVPKDKSYSGGLNELHQKLAQQTDYNPLVYFELNLRLLDFYSSLKDTYSLFVFTSETIQNAPEFRAYLEPVFDEMISALDLGVNKKDIQAYTKLVAKLNLKVDEVMYIDDSVDNVEAATQAGLKAILFKDNLEVIEKIRLLSLSREADG